MLRNTSIKLPLVDKEGYDFLGFYTGKSVNDRKVENGDKVFKDLTLFARFEPKKARVNLNSEGGDVPVDHIELSFGQKDFSLPLAKKKGNTFVGWFLDDKQITDSKGNALTSWDYFTNKELNAKWNLESYKLNITNEDEAKGRVEGSGDWAYGSNVVVKALPNEGYVFVGWFDSNGKQVSADSSYSFLMPDKSLTLSPKWKGKDIKVTFGDSDGSDLGIKESLVVFGQEAIKFEVPKKAGMTFGGYFSDGQRVTDGEGNVLGSWDIPKDVKLSAKWGKEGQTYSVKVQKEDENDETEILSGNGNYSFGEEVTLSASKKGYKFKGWIKDGKTISTDSKYSFVMEDGNKDSVYGASWEIGKYQITLNADGGELPDTFKEVQYQSSFSLPIPQKKGYSFDGWSFEGQKITDKSGASLKNFNFGNDIEVKANWVALQLTLNYVLDGKNIRQDKFTLDDNLDINGFFNPQDDTFSGWFKDPGLKVQAFSANDLEIQGDQVYLYGESGVKADKNNLTFISQGDSYLVSGYDGNKKAVEIPETYQGKPVVGIKQFDNNNVKYIIVPTSISSLDYSLNTSALFLYKGSNLEVTYPEAKNKVINDATGEFGEYGNFSYVVTSNNKVAITSYNGKEVDIKIPEMIEGKEVTRIQAEAFSGLDGFVENDFVKNKSTIFIPSNVTYVEKGSLDDFRVVLFGGSTLPESWDSSYKNGDKSIVFNATGETGTYRNFNYAKLKNNEVAITSLNASDSNISIPRSILGMDVTTIASYALLSEEQLNQIFIPKEVKNVGANLFSNPSQTTNTFSLASTYENLGGTFVFCEDRLKPEGWSKGWDNQVNSSWNGTGKIERDAAGNIYSLQNDGTLCLIKFKNPGNFSEPSSIIYLPAEVNGKKVTALGKHCLDGVMAFKVVIPDTITDIYGSLDLSIGTFFSSLKEKPSGWADDWWYTNTQGQNHSNPFYFGVTRPDYFYQGFEYAILPDGNVAITSCSLNQEIIKIPSMIDGRKVTSISGFSFASPSLTKVKEIYIPEGVTEISDSAFYYCQASTFHLPSTLKRIGSFAFYGTGITSLVIPESVEYIGDSAFFNNYKLTSASVPGSVKNIGNKLFAGCAQLKKIELGEGIVSIGKEALNCGITEIKLPESLKEIGDHAFGNSLRKLVIPKGVEKVGHYIFGDFSGLGTSSEDNLNRVIVICQGKRNQSGWANDWAYDDKFYSDQNLLPISVLWNCTGELGKGGGFEYAVRNDGSIWIYGCDQNTGIIAIPQKIAGRFVTGIAGFTFSNKFVGDDFNKKNEEINVETVLLPSTVSVIETYAFYKVNFNYIYLPKGVIYNNDPYLGMNGNVFAEANTRPSGWAYYVNSSSYLFGSSVVINDGDYSYVKVKEGIYIVGYNGQDANVILPSSFDDEKVIGIYAKAFYGNKTIETIDIPFGIRYIGDSAFESCGKLKGVKLPSSLVGIGNKAFKSTALDLLSLPDEISSIGDEAFFSTRLSNSIILPKNIIYMGSAVFGQNNDLTIYSYYSFRPMNWQESWDDGVQSVWDYADGIEEKGGFKYFVNSRGTVTILKYIGYEEEVIVPNTIDGKKVTFLNSYAFSGTSVSKVTISDGFTRIEDSTFENCYSLKEVVLPSSVNYIGDKAFFNSGLESIYLGENVVTIGENAFGGSDGNRNVAVLSGRSSASYGYKSDWLGEGARVVWNASSENVVGVDGEFAWALLKDGTVAVYKYYGNISFGMPISAVIPEEIQGKKVSYLTSNLFDFDLSQPDYGYIYIPSSVRIIDEGFIKGFRNYDFSITSKFHILCGSSKTSAYNNNDVFKDHVVWNVSNVIKTENGFTYALKNDDTAAILDYDGKDRYITIDKLGGYVVSEIADDAFTFDKENEIDYANKHIVIIKESVKIVGNNFSGKNSFYSSVSAVFFEHKRIPSSWNSGISQNELNRWNCQSGFERTNDGFVYVVSDGLAYIAGYEGKETSFNLPIKIGQNKVEGVLSGSFANRDDLVFIYISKDFNRMDADAFYNCPNLDLICEEDAKPGFWDNEWNGGCSFVWEATKDLGTYNGLGYMVKKDGNIIIYRCPKNQDYIEIPSSIDGKTVDEIAENALSGCDANVYIPKSVKKMLPPYDGGTIRSRYFFEDSVSPFGGAFSSEGVHFNIVEGIKTESDFKFFVSSEGYSILVSYTGKDDVVKIPSTLGGMPVTMIGKKSFVNCTAKEIVIPDSVKTIESSAFVNCQNIKGIVLPKSLTKLGYMFENCNSVRFVYLPKEVSDTFKQGNSLDFNQLNWTNLGASNLTYFFLETTENISLKVDDRFTALLGVTKQFISEGNFEGVVIQDGTLRLLKYTGTDSVVVIPSSLSNYQISVIDSNFLKNKYNVSEVYIPKGIKTIQQGAFANVHIIHCEDKEKPSGWEDGWAEQSSQITWNDPYKNLSKNTDELFFTDGDEDGKIQDYLEFVK